jgi:phosphate transport system protein
MGLKRMKAEVQGTSGDEAESANVPGQADDK